VVTVYHSVMSNVLITRLAMTLPVLTHVAQLSVEEDHVVTPLLTAEVWTTRLSVRAPLGPRGSQG